MENQEMSAQETVMNLRELLTHKGWNILKAHLEWHLTKKERVKAEAIRQAKEHEVKLNQGWIDGVSFVLGEPSVLIAKLKDEFEKEGEENARP